MKNLDFRTKNWQDYTDFAIKCGGEIFYCHKLFLAKASQYFARMFSEENGQYLEAQRGEMEIVDFDASIVHAFLRCIYGGNTAESMSLEELLSLYRIADKYDVQGITYDVRMFFDLKVKLSEQNFVDYAKLAAELKDERKIFKVFISFHFKKI